MERDRKRKGKGGNDGITLSFQKIKIIKKVKSYILFCIRSLILMLESLKVILLSLNYLLSLAFQIVSSWVYLSAGFITFCFTRGTLMLH